MPPRLITVAGTPKSHMPAKVSSSTSGSVAAAPARSHVQQEEQHDRHDDRDFFGERAQQRLLDAGVASSEPVVHGRQLRRRPAGGPAGDTCLTRAMSGREVGVRVGRSRCRRPLRRAPPKSASPLGMSSSTRRTRATSPTPGGAPPPGAGPATRGPGLEGDAPGPPVTPCGGERATTPRERQARPRASRSGRTSTTQLVGAAPKVATSATPGIAAQGRAQDVAL